MILALHWPARCAVGKRKRFMTYTFIRFGPFARLCLHIDVHVQDACMCTPAWWCFPSHSCQLYERWVKGGCQIRIRAALLIAWEESHVPLFRMESHSLTCHFPLSSWLISVEQQHFYREEKNHKICWVSDFCYVTSRINTFPDSLDSWHKKFKPQISTY